MPSVNSKEAFIALNMIEHVGPIRVRHLLQHFGAPEQILAASEAQLGRVPGIGAETARAIAAWETTIDLAGELRRIRESGCQVYIQPDEAYPASLREIYDPPIVLYAFGRLEARDRHAVAVVGSRLTTPYGMETARRFSWQLAQAGVTVVSGGARGIDTAAHQGALSGGGRTIAVLGTGINRVFPPENAELFTRIAARGAVITQFPFDRQADKQTFPIRNRIVAGMTLGTLVVEANLTSGALITAGMAVEAGRQVFAVPGRIDSPRSRGCHELIKKGAKLCEGIEDILTEFEYLFPPAKVRSAAPADNADAGSLSAEEVAVLGAIPVGGAQMEEIIAASGLETARVSVVLLGLELKRWVRQHPGRVFERART